MGTTMGEIMKYEARRRIKGTVALVVFLGFFALLVVYIYPSVEAAAGSIEEWLATLPESFQSSFAMDSYTTIEGFLASEVYQFVWLLLVGLYLVYMAGGIVAGDVESGRIDLLLATPVSRTRVIIEKYLSLLVPIAILNLVMPLFVFGGVVAIGESIDFADLLLLHLFSVPYLLLTGALGLALSVLFNRADIAQRGGLAALFMLFILDSVTLGTDFEWLGSISPTRYFSPIDILVDGTIDWTGTVLLVAATVALVIFSAERFKRADL